MTVTNGLHANSTGVNVHVSYAWEYADQAAREAASGLVSADEGKFARQLDDDSIWMLTVYTVPTWVAVGGDLSAYVAKALFDAQTILAATSDNTPAALTVPEATMVGRQTGANVAAIAQVSAGEITAGTEAGLRAFSPADVKSMAETHGGGGGGSYDYILFQHRQNQNTAAGGTATGAWNTCPLTNEISDDGNHASLSANDITLASGTYEADCWQTFFRTGYAQIRLYNVTDDTVIEYGSGVYAISTGGTHIASLKSKFTIAAEKVIRLQYAVSNTKTGDGLGFPANLGPERYAAVELRKENF